MPTKSTTPTKPTRKTPDDSIAEYRKRIFQLSAWDEFYSDVLLPSFRDPSNRRDIDNSFEPWFEKFIASEVLIGERGLGIGIKTALQKTCQLDVTGTTLLLSRTLVACFQAKHDGLPDVERRKGNSEFLQECPSQIKALKKITKFMKRYPEACGDALSRAYLTWNGDNPGGKIGVTLRGKTGVPFLPFCEEFLVYYANQLKRGVGARGKGPWLHRVKSGPLLYPDSVPLDRQKAQPDTRVNGLLFELALHFRWHTTPDFNGNYGGGMLMPTGGKPHANLVALLVNATLGTNLSAKAVQSRAQSLIKKGVVLTHW